MWPWACGSVWPVHSYIDVADLHRLTIRYNSAWPGVPPPWPWDLGARSATPLWNNGKHGNMSKVHTMRIKNMENQSWVLIIYTTVSGIAWLCTFSLLTHSNSKRHMKIINLSLFHIEGQIKLGQYRDKQRFLTPGHQGWNDLHRLCRIGMEYYLPNNDNNNNNHDDDDNNNNNNNNNNNKTMMIMIIRMMTMMIIGTTTIMIMIIIIRTTLTMTIMKMIMIKTAQTPCQSLYKDRRIQNKIAWYNWYNRNDVMLILYEMLHTCSIMHTQWRCKFEHTKHRCLGMFLHKCNLHCSGRN